MSLEKFEIGKWYATKKRTFVFKCSVHTDDQKYGRSVETDGYFLYSEVDEVQDPFKVTPTKDVDIALAQKYARDWGYVDGRAVTASRTEDGDTFMAFPLVKQDKDRFQAACAAMQGDLAHIGAEGWEESRPAMWWECADALLAELAKSAGEKK